MPQIPVKLRKMYSRFATNNEVIRESNCKRETLSDSLGLTAAGPNTWGYIPLFILSSLYKIQTVMRKVCYCYYLDNCLLFDQNMH